jgi:hypothetical protein
MLRCVEQPVTLHVPLRLSMSRTDQEVAACLGLCVEQSMEDYPGCSVTWKNSLPPPQFYGYPPGVSVACESLTRMRDTCLVDYNVLQLLQKTIKHFGETCSFHLQNRISPARDYETITKQLACHHGRRRSTSPRSPYAFT